MSLIDFILNLVGLLLWLAWRSAGVAAKSRTPGSSLLITLQPTSTPRTGAWLLLAVIGLILILRSVFYWHIGSALDWTPRMHLGAVVLSFRSDYFLRILTFSFLSFGLFLGAYYCWLLFLSAVNRHEQDTNPMLKMVRAQLGWMERLPVVLKYLFPLIMGALAWIALAPIFSMLGLTPDPLSYGHLAQEAIVVGISAFLVLKYLLLFILLLNVVNAYVFLGDLALWHFVNTSAKNMLRPIAWMRLGWIDLGPLIGITLLLLVSYFGPSGLHKLYEQLPF